MANIDNTGAVIGTVAIGEALSDPLKNTRAALQGQALEQDNQNVFQHARRFWSLLGFWALASWGTWELIQWAEGADAGWITFAGFVALFVLWVPFPLILFNAYAWHVRAQMLTRVFPILSTPWKMLAQVHGYSNQTALVFSIFLALIYPLTFGPLLLITDALRFVRFLIGFIVTGGKVRFGGTQFVWYKRQAKLYNNLMLTRGPEVANEALFLSSMGTDVGAALTQRIEFSNWKDGVREAVFAPKIKKYGNLLKQ